MPGLIHGLDPERIAANLERVRERVGDRVEILAATKYVPPEEMGALAEAGVGLVGENRQQDLAAKHDRWGETFEWDFIGNLQSRKVKRLLPICRLIHSVATDSTLEQLGRHGGPGTEVLVEVNVAGAEGKGGVAPARLGAFLERCPVRASGLMTMPPFSTDPTSPASPSWPPSTASSGSRWAPRRTGRSRSRRGRRSFAWGPRSTCEGLASGSWRRDGRDCRDEGLPSAAFGRRRTPHPDATRRDAAVLSHNPVKESVILSRMTRDKHGFTRFVA
jgi:hypothetical protein